MAYLVMAAGENGGDEFFGGVEISSGIAGGGKEIRDRGGESGASARPMKPEWATSIRDQCEKHDVAFFFKQWGGRNKKAAGRELEGSYYDTFPEPKVRRQSRQLA